MQNIILASGSPRRFDLLSGMGFDVTTVKPDFDESAVTEPDPKTLVRELARGKNRSVRTGYRGSLILSADTVVCIDGKILGKPTDEKTAFNMLKSLSGRTHTVFTGVCISFNNTEVTFAEQSDVTFYNLTDTQINKYIATGSPFDKAGGYGLQDDVGITFIKTVAGEISNVIGLPMGRVTEEILKITQGE